MQNKTYSSPAKGLKSLLKRTHILLLIVLGGASFLGSASAQPVEAANTKTGSIRGTVVDTSGDPIPGAMVALQGPAGNRLTSATKDDGTFAFREAIPEVAYQISVSAQGFADWNSSVSVGPGEDKSLSEIKLRILAVQRAVNVSYSSKEVAAQQLKVEEQQNILHFVPNLYVTYEPHPEPLTTQMKFHLAYKSLTSPAFFARTSMWASIQQAADTPNYGQGATGYGKRVGAGFADATAEGLIGNAILPSLLHQDPRYFYQGSGSTSSRALHAMLAAFICKGDNGKTQPNYSNWGGSLIATSISMAYYPSSDRDASHVFKNFGVGMGLHVVGGLAQEFILDKFTSRGKHK